MRCEPGTISGHKHPELTICTKFVLENKALKKFLEDPSKADIEIQRMTRLLARLTKWHIYMLGLVRPTLNCSGVEPLQISIWWKWLLYQHVKQLAVLQDYSRKFSKQLGVHPIRSHGGTMAMFSFWLVWEVWSDSYCQCRTCMTLKSEEGGMGSTFYKTQANYSCYEVLHGQDC